MAAGLMHTMTAEAAVRLATAGHGDARTRCDPRSNVREVLLWIRARGCRVTGFSCLAAPRWLVMTPSSALSPCCEGLGGSARGEVLLRVVAPGQLLGCSQASSSAMSLGCPAHARSPARNTGDKDIHQRFPDGIQCMSLGQEATVQVAIQEIVRAMIPTGAIASIARVEN